MISPSLIVTTFEKLFLAPGGAELRSAARQGASGIAAPHRCQRISRGLQRPQEGCWLTGTATSRRRGRATVEGGDMGRWRDREREGRAHEGHMGRARATEREREGEKSQESDTHAHRPNEKERCMGAPAVSECAFARPARNAAFTSRLLQPPAAVATLEPARSARSPSVPRAWHGCGRGPRRAARDAPVQRPRFVGPTSRPPNDTPSTSQTPSPHHLLHRAAAVQPHGNSRPHAHVHRTAHTLQEMCHGSHHAPRAPATST